MRGCQRALLGLGLALLGLAASASAASHEYKKGDLIVLYANKVGPFTNPTETYQFYNLPFCQPSGGKEYKIEDLGEVSSCSLLFGQSAHLLTAHASFLCRCLKATGLSTLPIKSSFG
jgi:hypothetical protein